MSEYHVSVLLQEAVDALQIVPGNKYIDATLGGGGHAMAILERGGIVLGIDQDNEALEHIKENLWAKGPSSYGRKLTIVQGNFSNIDTIARENGFEKVNGILFDIGVSSHQFDEKDRGFSLMHDGPLDMRMDAGQTMTAADLINGLHKGELMNLFTRYGEEPFARKIAEAIIAAREEEPILTTRELAEIVRLSVPKIGKVHPATRVFQALRIAVNDELHVLEEGLIKAVQLLLPKGRLVVISFHSLEDRIVKNTFEKFQEDDMGDSITKKPAVPSKKEMEDNKKSRSAKMRVFQKK